MSTRGFRILLALVIGVAALPALASGEVMNFKLLTNSSQASFRSDAPLETFVGTSALEGIQGTLSVDPARPWEAKGSVKVDMNRVTTGVAERDTDMRGKHYLNTEVEANRWVTFEVKKVEITEPLAPGRETPARIHGVLTVKNKPVDTVADGSVTYVKLPPEHVEQQKRWGLTSDNLKVKAKLASTFTNHGMQIPQILFLKVANEIQMAADLVFVRAP